MSTLVVSNISDGTTTVGASYVTNGSAKAWGIFQANPSSLLLDSYNVSSLTDNGTGDFSLNFSNAMNTVNYSIQMCSNANVTNQGGFNRIANNAPVTTYARVWHYENNSRVDTEYNSVEVTGDLA